MWKQLHFNAGKLPAALLSLQSLCDCAEAGLHSPKKHNRVFVTPDNSHTSLLRVISQPSAIPFRRGETNVLASLLGTPGQDLSLEVRVPLMRLAEARCCRVPRLSCAIPALGLGCCSAKPETSLTAAPPILTPQASWVVVVSSPSAFFNCQTRLCGNLLRSNYFAFNTTAKILWSHITARKYLL